MNEPTMAHLPARLAQATTALAWVAVALAVATFVRLASLLGLGLELTDESYNLLSALHPDSIRLFFSAAHWLTAPLWKVTGSLYAFRATGLVLVTASGLVLGWGVLRLAPLAGIAVPTLRIVQAAVMAAGASGALLFGSLLSFTPSYNLVGTACVGIAMGAGMLSIASEGRLARPLEVLAGVVLGMAVLCKFSAGICTAGLLVVLQAVFLWRRPHRLWGPLLVIACAAVTVIVAAALTTGLHEGWRQFRVGLEVIWVAQGDKGMLARLLRSAFDTGALFTGMALTFWGPLACFAVGMFWRPLLLGSLGAAWFAAVLWLGNHGNAGMNHYLVQPLAWAAMLCIALLSVAPRWVLQPRAALLALTLAAMPFAAALGTSNPLQTQILGTMAPWGVLLGLAGYNWTRNAIPAALVSVLFGALVLAQVIANSAAPYRMLAHAQQTQDVSIDALGTVKVDARTAAMVRDLRSAARECAIAPGAPFLDFYNLPGVALIVGAVPVETPWLLHARYAQAALKGADPAVLRQAVVAVSLNAAGERPQAPPQLTAFPQGWRLCGRTAGPLDGLAIELWAPDSPTKRP